MSQVLGCIPRSTVWGLLGVVLYIHYLWWEVISDFLTMWCVCVCLVRVKKRKK